MKKIIIISVISLLFAGCKKDKQYSCVISKEYDNVHYWPTKETVPFTGTDQERQDFENKNTKTFKYYAATCFQTCECTEK